MSSLDDLNFSFVPPEDSGQPQTNRAGGRRNQFCNSSTPTLAPTLVIPSTSNGITTVERPTILAYLPQTSAQQAFLTLEDEQNHLVYNATVALPESKGIVRFTIPDTAPALELEKDYQISLAIVCDVVLDPNDPVLEGWIKRIELDADLAAQQAQLTELETAALYANNGIWFDAVATLADLRQSQADNPDVLAAWAELLQSVELEIIQDADILNNLHMDHSAAE
ncbi:MAG: DUF928 domain-containing protein [Cyanobacteria bacterium J06636_16]